MRGRFPPESVYRASLPPSLALCYTRTDAKQEERRRGAAARSMLTRTEKEEITSSIRLHASDTGSSDVQVALLTERIRQMTDHLRVHRKDHHSQRGLMKIVGRRRRLLRYLGRREPDRYKALIAALGIRK